MLRGVVVGEVERLRDAGRLHDDALRDGLAHDVDTRQRTCLRVDLRLNGGDRAVGQADGDEDDLRVDAMLGLGEQIGGDEGRVARFVRNDLRVPVRLGTASFGRLMDLQEPRRALRAYQSTPTHPYRSAPASSRP